MNYYCTYFDQHYLPRGLALYASMTAHCPPFTLFVLCLDDTTYEYLRAAQLPGCMPIPLAELERADPDLTRCKANRTRIEYYFTCTPALLLHLLTTHPDLDTITYIDADFFFFGCPDPIRVAFEGHSIYLVEHRFSPGLQCLQKYGRYNVGILGFRNDPAGLSCIRWWRERCLEWCYDRLEGNRFADQKYLDDWPERFPGVLVLRHKGVNLAPWNVAQHRLWKRAGQLLVDGEPLVCFHFHNLRVVFPFLFTTGLAGYRARLTPPLVQHVYGPYVRTVAALLPARQKLTSIRKGNKASWAHDLSELAREGGAMFVIGARAYGLNVGGGLSVLLYPLLRLCGQLADHLRDRTAERS